MGCSGGNSPGMTTTTTTTTTTAGLQSSGLDGGDFLRLMDQRKRRRMESNRESARRSRIRKQMQLDELAMTATRLASENSRLAAGISVAARQLMAVEAENSVLRAQLVELSSRLDSLNKIVSWVEPGSVQGPDWFGNSQGWIPTWHNQPIAAASHDIFRH